MSDTEAGRKGNRHSQQCAEALHGRGNEKGSSPRSPSVVSKAGSGSCAVYDDAGLALLEALPLGILITDANGEITYCNTACQKLLEVSASRLIGTPWWLAMDARDQAVFSARWHEENEGSRSGTVEARLITGSGRRIWTRYSITGLLANQAPGTHIHTIEDISGMKAAEQAGLDALDVLYRERERARVTLECIGDAVISTDAQGLVTFMNTVAEQLTGWTVAEADGKPLSRIFRVIDADSGEPISNPAHQAMEALETVQLPANSLLMKADGSEMAIEDSAAPILDRTGRLTGAVVIFRDRRLSRENTERMSHLARHDALTGLPNRVAFAEHFEQAIKLAQRQHKKVGLLFIDVDRFKPINDCLGHRAGDRLLKDLSRKLAACVRSTDLVCRHGGDEFVATLGGISQVQNAEKVAAKMQAAAARLRHDHSRMPGLALSIGVSLYPDHGTDRESLLHRADAAMYHAKISSGKGCCVYQQGMGRPMPGSRLETSADARQRTDNQRSTGQ